MSDVTADVKRGLAGVVADTTAVSVIDPETGSLLYRGYPVPELAARCNFEQVAYLLWHGQLPQEDQLTALSSVERANRQLPPELVTVLGHIPLSSHPMDVLRTAVSFLGASGAETGDEMAQALRLWAKLPTIVAAEQRRRRGLAPVEPSPTLSFSENFFYMCTGEVPDPEVVRCLEISLILYAEHGFNASTFAARVITSTLSDLFSAVTGAIGALKGPLHGGANEAVMGIFEVVRTPAAVPDWLAQQLSSGQKIMGFGHRVYKQGDSRVPTMYGALQRLAARSEEGQQLVAVYAALERAMGEAKGLYPNLDYPSGPAFHLMGFDVPTFTPIFVMSRVVGWTAHVMEQLAHNSLIRPLSAYVGEGRRPVPLA
jgi:citrate synthase